MTVKDIEPKYYRDTIKPIGLAPREVEICSVGVEVGKPPWLTFWRDKDGNNYARIQKEIDGLNIINWHVFDCWGDLSEVLPGDDWKLKTIVESLCQKMH